MQKLSVMSQQSYSTSNKSYQNPQQKQNLNQNNYGYQQPTSNQYQRNYNYPHYQNNHNQYRGYDQYYEQYYPQGYQNYEDPNYYQPYYQPNPNQRQNQYQQMNKNMSQPFYQQQYAYQQMQQAKKKLMSASSFSNGQQKNMSQSQGEDKNHNQQNSLLRSVAYQPGQQTTTQFNLPKKVGLPNWQNPYKESWAWQSRDSSFRYQQPQKPKGYREKHQTQLNKSLSDPFDNKSNYDDNFFNQDSVRPEQRGIHDVGRFGGAKKKKKRQNADQSVASIQSIPAKKKEKSLAQQSNNMGYFTVKTEYVQTVNCPFDPSHIMEPSRLLTHISRCKEKCETAFQYEMCPYDPTHYYRFDQIEAHKNVCDKRPQFQMEDFWNLEVDINQSTRPNISLSYISSSNNNKESQILPPAAQPTHQFTDYDPDRTKFENFLITDF